MKLSRRELFGLGAGAAALGALGGCERLLRRTADRAIPASALPKVSLPPLVRFLNRATFGPSPGQVAAVEKLGKEVWLDQQLQQAHEEPWDLLVRLNQLDVLQLGSDDLLALPEEHVMRQLQRAAILRAVYSPNQVRERAVDFWTNHFNVYARKGRAAFRKGVDETKVVREHALGKFKDMLWASAHSPAMLVFLDNQRNDLKAPNENYAREIMELHTLGVHGGYTQKDVQEVARCFTGWSVERRFLRPKGSFRFIDELHDQGEKVVLGHKIPANGGIKDGERVLEILASHPSTAKFLATKLCIYYVGSAPGRLIESVARTYETTGGDIQAMLRQILLSDELIQADPIMKRPFDLVISSLRAFAAQTSADGAVLDTLARMGQPLFQWPMPDGYPVETEAWTGTMMARWNFAYALTHGGVGDTRIDFEAVLKSNPQARPAELLASLAPCVGPSTPEGKALIRRLELALMNRQGQAPFAAALCLATPEFQWR